MPVQTHSHECVSLKHAVQDHSLPKFGDRGGKVGHIGCQPKGLILADCVLHTVFCVPGLLAFCPGELWLKALKQVIEPPGEDHNVVDV